MGSVAYRLARVTLARFAVLAAAVGLALAPAAARAEDAHPGEDNERVPVGEEHQHHDASADEAPAVQLPLRVIGSLGFGATLRLVVDPALRQSSFAPAYLEARGGIVFPGSGVFRHGVVLGIATNLSGDGPTGTNYMPDCDASIDPRLCAASHARGQGMDRFAQWVITPSYLAYFRLSEDFVATARGGLPLVLSPYLLLGFEAGGSFTWMITAGFGIFAELNVDMWLGIDAYPYFTASGALGAVIDYEVLP